MNQHDSAVAEGLLRNAGYLEVQAPEAADVILFNTCCVRGHAEQKLYGRISQLRELKEIRPDLILGVGGCVAQKEKERLPARCPDVDLVFGTNTVHDIVRLLEKVADGEKPLVAVPEDGPALRTEERVEGVHAWVSILRGCNNYCSYCIVPYVRGRQRSKPTAEVFDEVSRLVQKGVKEVTLLGQNVNAYGQDLGGNVQFADLLKLLDNISGLARIRFTTSHPKDLTEELMHAIRDLPSVCEHLHLPVQSGSSRILGMMSRGYTAVDYLEKVETLRGLIPALGLTTDVIVGFPGETDRDFDQTRELFEQAQFDSAYIFKYSPREGTAAARMKDRISGEVLKARHQNLLALQKDISRQRLTRLIGTEQCVLPDRDDLKREGYLTGRTRGYRTASFPAKQHLLGKEICIRIQRIDRWTLIGEHSES